MTFQRTLDIFLRALRVISLVSIVFFVLIYGFGGSAENSILYKLGVLIEPVTMFFGLKWQAFLAFCASAISKESLLGVLNTLYDTGGSLVSSTFGAKVSGTAAAGISQIPVRKLYQGGGTGLHLRDKLQYALRQRLGRDRKRNTLGQMDSQDRRVLHARVSADRLCRLSYRAAGLLSANK